MLEGTSSGKFGITSRSSLASILLVANSLIWYFYAATTLEEVINKITPDFLTTLLMWSIHFAGVTFSALAGASLVNKMGGRTRFLMFWMMLGVASSFITLIVVNTADASSVLVLSFLFGISLGLGMPNCMGYYTNHTSVENRGRLGGIIMLVSGLGIFFLGIFAIENTALQALILVAWRASGLVIFRLIKPPEGVREKIRQSSYGSIFNQRSFILYFFPWVMFALVTYLSTPVQFSILGRSTAEVLIMIENVIIGIFAIVGGLLSDSVGRKRMAIIGFVMLGLGYSILGIYPEELFSWYFSTVVDGVAWGILFVIFVITIWGDLSYGAPSDKYYAVGVLPFFISKLLEFAIGKDIVAVIPTSAIFSFTAFFLFLAVIPLMYTPETLPEKKIKERELKKYIEKAKKIKEKSA